MSSSALSRNINQNGLPDDIFNYNNEQFYDYIKQSYGDDLAGLLRFQAIRNGSHLVETSCEDILLIFQQESEEINKLRHLCCFKISNNKYEIKLGVKLAINNLIELLKVKQEEQKKKKKQTSTKRTSSNIDTLKSVDQFQSHNEMIAPPTIAASPDSDTSSTQLALQLIQNRLNDIDHLTDIEQRINKWWRTHNNNNNLFLSEGTHYLLEINKSINDTYACILSCKCRIRFKLPFMATGFFKLSAYYRHLKEKPCLTMSKTTRKKYNNSINNENSANQSNISSKRTWSPSRETTSNTKENVLKKSKSSSSSSSSNNKHIDQD
ncbi:unnamed protein product [Rotaria sp. Silwood2]|nr:unnamed protein product [Rotaria sp. Silwood2]CAF3056206.1 unnamed protein product [Rotaria sp. Silwood2]CAF4448049.1 unnamed protein product [Rotaria sp. Silwood2]